MMIYSFTTLSLRGLNNWNHLIHVTSSTCILGRTLSTTQSLYSRLAPSKPIYVENLSMRTCGNLFTAANSQSIWDRKFFITGWHLRGGPNEGLPVNVEYIDTKPIKEDDKEDNSTSSSTTPVILALHGCPGSHQDFQRMILKLGHKYRIISPNFPNFSLTEETNYFWHSAEEKAQFVRDFLAAINVKEIDCLVAHSSSVFPSSYLWLKGDTENSNLTIKSLALFNTPGPYWVRMKQYPWLAFMAHVARFPSVRDYFDRMQPERLAKWFRLKNKLVNYSDITWLWLTVYLSRFYTFGSRLNQLAEQKTPTLFMFGLKDRLFNPEIYYNALSFLNVNAEHFDVYEPYHDELIQVGKAKEMGNDWIKVVNIQGGGHYCHITHWEILEKYLVHTIEKGRKECRNSFMKIPVKNEVINESKQSSDSNSSSENRVVA